MTTILRDRVECNGIVFNEPLERPADVLEWGMDLLDGWDATPELQARSTPLGGTVDGEVGAEFDAYRARHILASGYVLAINRLAAETVMDLLWRDVFPRNTELLLTRFETTPKFVRARVSAAREFRRVGPAGFRWEVPLRADDPFKYGTIPMDGEAAVAGLSTSARSYPRTYPLVYSAVAGSVEAGTTLVNVGTAPTGPIATLHGPLPSGGWRLTNETTGEEIRFAVGLDENDTLEINFRTEVALLNGFPVTATITGDFWKVVPGANVIKLYAPFDPAAGFTITADPAWE